MTDDAMSPGTMRCAMSCGILEIVPKPVWEKKLMLVGLTQMNDVWHHC